MHLGDNFIQPGMVTYCIAGTPDSYSGLSIMSMTNNRMVCKAPPVPLGSLFSVQCLSFVAHSSIGPTPIGVVVQNNTDYSRHFSAFYPVKARGDCLLGVTPRYVRWSENIIIILFYYFIFLLFICLIAFSSSSVSCIVGGSSVYVTTTGNYGFFKWVLFSSKSDPNMKGVVNAACVPNGNNNTYMYEYRLVTSFRFIVSLTGSAQTPTWLSADDAMVAITTGPGGYAISNQIPIQYTANCLLSITPPAFCVLGSTTAILHGQYLPTALNRMLCFFRERFFSFSDMLAYQQVDIQTVMNNGSAILRSRFIPYTSTLANFTTPTYNLNRGVAAGVRLLGFV
jgi:hypothetical protein